MCNDVGDVETRGTAGKGMGGRENGYWEMEEVRGRADRKRLTDAGISGVWAERISNAGRGGFAVGATPWCQARKRGFST